VTTSRRTVLTTAAAATAAAATAGPLLALPGASSAPATDRTGRGPGRRLDRDVLALEASYGVRIGFVARDLASGRSIEHRADERFPLLSVFKVLAAAAVLRDLDRGALGRVVRYDAADLVDYSPVTSLHVADGMSVAALCDAALRFSDNTAGNLLLRQLGGPRAITRFARSTGDRVTRLDRWETELNEALPGDPRDTTSARATAGQLTRLLVGRGLEPRDRARLAAWMLGNTTSAERFRRPLPAGWTLADKTGSGERGTANDVGVAWSPEGAPLVLAAYTRQRDPGRASDSRPLAALADLALRRLTD
jgi:beta-lactamase class A